MIFLYLFTWCLYHQHCKTLIDTIFVQVNMSLFLFASGYFSTVAVIGCYFLSYHCNGGYFILFRL